MSQNASTAYNAAWISYRESQRKWEKLADANVKLREWVRSSVSDEIWMNILDPIAGTRAWYLALKEKGVIAMAHSQTDALLEYRDHLRKVPSSLSKMSKWVREWENLMAVGIRYGASDTTNPQTWAQDILTTLRPIMPTWVLNTRQNYWEDLVSGDYTYTQLAEELTREINMELRAKPTRNHKAGFVTLHGQEADDDEQPNDQPPELANHSGRGSGRGRGRGGRGRGGRGGSLSSGKRKRQDPLSEYESSAKCNACLSKGHTLKKCFYINHKIRPEGWTPHPIIEHFIKERRQEHQSLEAEIQRVLKEKDNESD